MTMFSFNRVGARPNASARNPSTAASDRQPFAVRLASDVLVVAGILALFGLIAWILPAIGEPIGPKGVPSQVSTHLADLPYYALRSVFRMLVALFFSLVFTFIYGTAAARCRRLSRVLIPLLDILQSVPILGFLSATITIWMALFPGSMLGVEAASIFAIFTSQAWNMAFSFTRSLTSEPTELDEAARSLQLTRWPARWVGPVDVWAADVKSARSRALDVVFTVLVLAACAFGLVQLMLVIHRDAGFGELGQAFVLGMVTFLRVALLTLVCSVIWVPIGAMIGMNPRVSRFMQPIMQVLASFPSNFTFPFVTLWFVACSVDINWGSILLMALGTQWYILFNVIAGASQIPDDLREMTRSFQLGRWQRWRDLILPAVFGSWVTGGITAAGGAWNASIVPEIVSYGRHTLTASGLGAYIAEATESGNTVRTIIGVAVMSVFVVAVNRLFWNPLQRMTERRFALN